MKTTIVICLNSKNLLSDYLPSLLTTLALSRSILLATKMTGIGSWSCLIDLILSIIVLAYSNDFLSIEYERQRFIHYKSLVS